MGRSLTTKQQKFAAFLLGAANGNGTMAAKLAGYRGDDRQLAVQASVNRRNALIQKIISERLDALVEPSLKAFAGGLEATKRRAFVIGDEIRYTDPEPDHRVRVETADKVLDRHQLLSNHHAAGPDPDDTVQQQIQDCTEAQKAVAGLDPTDRNLIRRTSEIDQKLADIEHQLAEDDDGTERQGQN